MLESLAKKFVGKNIKQMAVAYFMLLSRYIPEWTVDKHENPQPD